MENKKWLAGKEVMERYEIQVKELGEACYEGKLKAYQADTCKEILEETKVAKIPAYTPQGINPRDHVKYGVNIEWEWREEVEDANFEWPDLLNCEIHKQIFDVCFQDNIIDHNQQHFPYLFPFKIEDYVERENPHRELNAYPDIHSDLYTQLSEQYKQKISEMLFKPADIRSYLDTIPQEMPTLIPVNIPASLWAGKTPEAIFSTLTGKNFAPEIIAYILMEKTVDPIKTTAGSLFYQKKRSKGKEPELRTYQKK